MVKDTSLFFHFEVMLKLYFPDWNQDSILSINTHTPQQTLVLDPIIR